MTSMVATAAGLVFLGTAQFLIGMLVAETLYPGYSVSLNYISDLGATCNSTCVIVQPSSIIFNSSVFSLGALLAIAAFLTWKSPGFRLVTVLLAVTGLGAMGVGLFPETTGVTHEIVSLVAFLGAGLTAIASSRLARPYISYIAVILGGMTLVALALYISRIYLGLGAGGMERMIVYPALAWGMAFGGYFSAHTDSPQH